MSFQPGIKPAAADRADAFLGIHKNEQADKKNSFSESFSAAMAKTGEVAFKALKIIGAVLGSITIVPLFFQAFRHFASDTLLGTKYAEDKAAIKEEMATPLYQANVREQQEGRDLAARAKEAAKEIAVEKAINNGEIFDETKFEENYVEMPRLVLSNAELKKAAKNLKQGEKNKMYDPVSEMNKHIAAEKNTDEFLEQIKEFGITPDNLFAAKNNLRSVEVSNLEVLQNIARTTSNVVSDSIANHPRVWTAAGLGTLGAAAVYTYNR